MLVFKHPIPNVWPDIIKIILGYPQIVAPESLKEWKVVITLVGQGYKSTEGQNDYKTETGTTYKGWELPMDIEKSKENFKNRKPRCFNYNLYGHMTKNCQKLKKEKDNRKCYKCKWVGHIAKDCKTELKMKNWNVQKDTRIDIENEDEKKGFEEDPK